MKVYGMSDINYLLKLFISDGFTLECLSKTTNTPIEVLEKCITDPPNDIEFDKRLNCPFFFLQILYNWYSYDDDLKDYVESVCHFYSIPKKALSNYMGMNEALFDDFIKNYRDFPNGSELVIKLDFVLSLFGRDKSGYS